MGSTTLKGKRVVVLSDNELLSRALELNLSERLCMEIVEPAPGSVPWPGLEKGANHLELIIVAMSAHSGEPLLALVRASLAEHIGRVPILIISDRRFESQPWERIAHLDFPFHPDQLHGQVTRLLRAAG